MSREHVINNLVLEDYIPPGSFACPTKVHSHFPAVTSFLVHLLTATKHVLSTLFWSMSTPTNPATTAALILPTPLCALITPFHDDTCCHQWRACGRYARAARRGGL